MLKQTQQQVASIERVESSGDKEKRRRGDDEVDKMQFFSGDTKKMIHCRW